MLQGKEGYTRYYVETPDGFAVSVPESKFDAWQSADHSAPLTEEEERMKAAIIEQIYGQSSEKAASHQNASTMMNKTESRPDVLLQMHNNARRLVVGKTLHNANMQAFFQEFPYDPYVHNGARNPYTGDIIATEDDYKRYAHEHVYSRECDKVLNNYYETILKEKENVLKEKESELFACQKKSDEMREKSEKTKADNERLRRELACNRAAKHSGKDAIFFIVIFLLCGIVSLLLSFLLQTKDELRKLEDSLSQSSAESRVQENILKNSVSPNATSSQKQSSSTPTPQKQSGTSQSNNDSSTVYITNSGSKYHKKGCQHLSESSKSIDLSKAKKQGYEPCSKCY